MDQETNKGMRCRIWIDGELKNEEWGSTAEDVKRIAEQHRVRIGEVVAAIVRVSDTIMSTTMVGDSKMRSMVEELSFTRTITVEYDMGGAVRQSRMPIEAEVKDAPVRVITLKE